MSDFSPIPLDKVRSQFLDYQTSNFENGALFKSPKPNLTPSKVTLSPYKLSPKRLSPERFGCSKSPLKVLSDADNNSIARSPFYKVGDDSKASINFDKEKEVLQQAGYSTKLSSAVLDELTRKAEKLAADSVALGHHKSPSKLADCVSLEKKFDVIHQKEFSKMPSIASHYSAIRRKNQVEDLRLKRKHSPDKEVRRASPEKRKSSDDEMPRTEMEIEKSEIEVKTPVKQSKRSSNAELGSASKRRRTLIGPREVPTSFKSPGRKSPEKNSPESVSSNNTPDVKSLEVNQEDMSIDSPSRKKSKRIQVDGSMKLDNPDPMASMKSEDHLDVEKAQKEVEQILGLDQIPTTEYFTFEDVPRPQDATSNVKAYIEDDNPIEPLRISKSRSNLLSKSNILFNQSAQPHKSSKNTNKADVTVDQSMIRRFKNANIDSDYDDSLQDVNMQDSEPVFRTILPTTTRQSKKSYKLQAPRHTEKSDRYRSLQRFSSSKSLDRARDLSLGSSSSINSRSSVFSNRKISGSSIESNDGFVKPIGRPVARPAGSRADSNIYKVPSSFRGTQNTLKSTRSMERIKITEHPPTNPTREPVEAVPFKTVAKKSSIPRFSQPTVSSLSRQSSKTSLNGYLTSSYSSSNLSRQKNIRNSSSNTNLYSKSTNSTNSTNSREIYKSKSVHSLYPKH